MNSPVAHTHVQQQEQQQLQINASYRRLRYKKSIITLNEKNRQGFPGWSLQVGTGVEIRTFSISFGLWPLTGPNERSCSLSEQVLQNLNPEAKHWKHIRVALSFLQS